VDKAYEQYCFADPLLYDAPTRIDRPELEFALTSAPPPEGWDRSELDDWIVCWPNEADVPVQGWKIHASACLDNAQDVLEKIWSYCTANRIGFKFVRSLHHFFLRNAKYADRGASGKLAAVYPADIQQLERVLVELGEILEREAGPYILSDLRWASGPLYVRYGGFAERYCINDRGEAELAIADPSGKLVPDRRGPTFEIPEWESLPAFLIPHFEARARVTVSALPYEIDRALHFSNGGGIYHAVDRRDGSDVVLKEARPHAGLAMDRSDAVERLERERDVLERLSGLGCVPRLRDHFVLGEHHFLVRDFVDATPLSDLIARRFPLTLEEPGEQALSEYASWAVGLIEQVERAVAQVHDRGIVIGDIHPSNMMVTSEETVVLIDFEVASDVTSPRRQALADPGFLVPAQLIGIDADRYALSCLRLAMFLPLTELFALEPAKARELAEEITALFPVPHKLVEEAASFITNTTSEPSAKRSSPSRPEMQAGDEHWPLLRESIAQGILASATLDRDDRLYPGDIHQFSTGGLNLAYGAAGVLYALATTGAPCPPAHVEWLVERAIDPKPGSRLGLYDGLHGVAYALDVLGRREEAMKVLAFCADDVGGKWEQLGQDLYAGLAGIGLSLAHFAAVTGNPSTAEDSRRVVEIVAERLGDEDSVAEVSGGEQPFAGLLRGSSGPALLFLRHFDATGDTAFLDLAATALRQDLRRCYLRDDGSLEVNEGWRTMPYVADGSVGIGMVLDRYLARRPDERFAGDADAISKAARGQFYIEPGLFYGRAGMVLYLAMRHHLAGAAGRGAVQEQIRRLSWHTLSYQGHIAFPGEQLLRLSMDLATGSAGVLLALGAALHAEPAGLPFLDQPQVPESDTWPNRAPAHAPRLSSLAAPDRDQSRKEVRHVTARPARAQG
jgi:serine/threonine protein kinase